MSGIASILSPPRGAPVNRWLVLCLVGVAQFMVVLDATIVNVALPSIQRGLDFSPTGLQWTINAYTLCFGGFLLLGGRAADLFGRQRLFVAGVAIFTLASLVNGIAPSAGVLVGGRALQGLGGALVSPAALSIVTTTFADGRERTKALGIWSAISAGGGAVGLVLGGVLTEYLSWRWVFFVNLPIGLIAVLLALRFVPNSRAQSRPETSDVAGAVTVTGGLLALVYAIVKGHAYGWTAWQTFALFAGALALLAAFVAVESRSRAPLIRLDVLRIRSLAVANGAMLLVGAGMFAQFYFVTLYLQNVLGYSPIKAGLTGLPFTVGIVVGAGLAQQLIRRVGVRLVGVVGLGLAVAGLLLYVRITADGTYVGQVLPPIVLMSIGMGLTFVPITLLATTNVDESDAGLASGLFNTSQQVGGSVGLAVLASVAASRTAHLLGGAARPSASRQVDAVLGGYHVAFVVGAGFMAGGLVLIATLLRRRDVEQINTDEPLTVAA